MQFEGWKPPNKSYVNRNPGNLRDSAGNYRVFQTLVEGYSALLSDLRGKFTGNTKTGLGPDSTLKDLMYKYSPPSDNNPTDKYIQFIADWLTKALPLTVTASTQLKQIWAPVVVPDDSPILAD